LILVDPFFKKQIEEQISTTVNYLFKILDSSELIRHILKTDTLTTTAYKKNKKENI
jgi:hypothetical protein